MDRYKLRIDEIEKDEDGDYVRHSDLRELLTVSDDELTRILRGHFASQWVAAKAVLAHLRSKSGIDEPSGGEGEGRG